MQHLNKTSKTQDNPKIKPGKTINETKNKPISNTNNLDNMTIIKHTNKGLFKTGF